MVTEDLVFNPNARLEVLNHEGHQGFRLFAPARERGACDIRVWPTDIGNTAAIVDPALTKLLARIHQAEDDLALEDDEVEQLIDLQVLVSSEQISGPVEYRCLLDEIHDGSTHVTISPDEVATGVAVTESITEPPAGVEAPLFLYRWSREQPIAWVRDRRFFAVFPYHLSPGIFDKLRILRHSRVETTASTRALLQAAGILLDPAVDERWRRQLERARASYQLNAYALVESVIPLPQQRSLAEYYAGLIREGYIPFGDRQVPLRYYRHSEHVMAYFHRQYVGLYQAIAETPIKPSYCYLGSYLPGAILERHTDREQCEFTASTQIDFLPADASRSPWTLYLEQKDSPAESFGVNLRRGDTVFYRGRELAHYRYALPANHASTSYFLHYVHASFEGTLD